MTAASSSAGSAPGSAPVSGSAPGAAPAAAPGDSPASDWATALLAAFVRRGVRDVVLSPGSRSQALALAAARFERAELLRLHVRIDERVGGFVALGLAIETQTPVLVITTSGTAVANLHPAVLEASHSGVPLIVLSADRPDELRGIGANQTTVQSSLFGSATVGDWDVPAPGASPAAHAAQAPVHDTEGSQIVPQGGRREQFATPRHDSADATDDVETRAVRLVDEVLAAACGSGTSAGSAPGGAAAARPRSGPVQLNLAFREPLSGAARLPDVEPGVFSRHTASAASAAPFELVARPGTVVVAGAGAGAVAEETARALGAPLLAEIASGARFGPNLVPAYRRLLATANFGDRVERVVVFGHPTLSREVPALIERAGVESIVVRSPGRDDYDPGHRVGRIVDAVRVVDDGAPADAAAVQAARSWVGRWVHASRQSLEVEEPSVSSLDDDYQARARFARDQLERLRRPVTRRELVEAVWSASWPHDRLVLGASRLIREADAVLPGKKLRVHANRGLAGIDGTVSTAIGIALAAQRISDSDAGDAGTRGDGSADAAAAASSARGTTRVLLGDLALLHDAGALLFGAGERRPRVQVIVGNDGGGTIFDGLEVAGSADRAAFDRVMLTPQSAELGALAAAYGWEYRRVENRGELDQALTASAGPTLIEVPLPR